MDSRVEKILRDALFINCESKEQLHKWIKVYLGIDLPNCIVCDDDIRNPPSNSSPMDLIWEMYSKAIDGTDPKYTQVLGFSAREGFKTLSAAIIETLCLLHLGRDVVHLAALEVQAKNCQSYVERFLRRPILREFLVSKNKREIFVTRYEDEFGNILSPVQWDALMPMEKNKFESISNSMKIVICAADAANGLHAPFMVMDELDLADPAGVEEAKMIPVEIKEDGKKKLPITFLTSTRKYSFGQVQAEIDNADNTDLQIRHWNIIDVTEACPPSRHLPEEPKIPIYYSEVYLKAIDEESYKKLSDKEKEYYEVKEGYTGCLKNCKIFAQCKGRLVNKQTSNSPLLKSIDHTQTTMGKVSVDTAKAQYLCWKPSSEGLVYPYFSKEVHMLPANLMANRITGEDYSINFTKGQLIELMKDLGAQFFCGLDWGYTHNFAVVVSALIGHILYVFDVIHEKGLELPERVELCKKRLVHLKPVIYPDNAYPSDIKTFRRAGFKMIDFQKDVLAGIEAVRARLMPGSGRLPSIFFLKDEEGCEFLAEKIMKYHWKMDKNTGKLTDEPDSNNDDELDALRYLGQNVPLDKSKVIADFSLNKEQALYPESPNKNWMKQKVKELTNDSDEQVDVTGKAGGFMFTI
jgi:hypothetical protein